MRYVKLAVVPGALLSILLCIYFFGLEKVFTPLFLVGEFALPADLLL